jgi:hypothetical protein
MDNSRRVVLYHPKYVEGFRNALAEAREDLRVLHARHLDQLDDLRREVSELRSIFADVVASLRVQAEADVHALRRKLEAALARLERDPRRPLH